ncbi:hypothetical protein LNN31_05195 [Acetobacterium wieringae]|uniref:LXG domain-containing protein n=1 Tax=Acetobacterium wieringae TaxID=52694 RepID=A0ABY6HHE1_9FIRM|nr:hypothetical protein [Acetobacterium wieringae]UYO63828.1 hypothetical protein LNN31_05195 [Acetobacterium wieringae]VUZ27281.1 Uncharacterised protein [Acetobacterium wieringae]
MIIKINAQSIICENTIEKTTDSITEILNRDNAIAIDYIVDGTSINEELGNYLSERLAITKEIEVITQPVKQLIQETINSAYAYLKNAIPQIRSMASEFEMEPDAITWQSLNELLEGLNWLIDSMERMNALKSLELAVNDYVVWNQYAQITYNLIPTIKDLDAALRNKNNRKVGRILSKEIVPAFEVMGNKLYGLMTSPLKM